MQTVAPQIGSKLHHAIEIQAAIVVVLGIEICQGFLAGGEGSARHPLHCLARLSTESEPGTDAWFILHLQALANSVVTFEHSVIHQVSGIVSQYEVTAETSRLAPSLVNAMHRIIAIHHMIEGINLDVALPFITIRIDDQMHQLVLFGSDTEDGGMAQCRHLSLEMLLLQIHRIVMRMRNLIGMTERSGALLGLEPQLIAQGGNGKGTVILHAATHYPMAAAETLQKGVLIIIRCDAFLFGILGLRSPEVLPVRNEYGRQGLAMLLAALAKQAGTLGVGLCRAHHRVDGIQLADVLQVVDAFVHLLLPLVPRIVARAILHLREDIDLDVLLVEHELHQDGILGILIENHLQIRCHRNHPIHLIYIVAQNHLFLIILGTWRKMGGIEEERKQAIECRIVTEAKGCRRLASTQGGISLSLDVLPERNGTTCRNRLVGRFVAIDDGHATVVCLIDGLELLIREEGIQGFFYVDRINREIQAHILDG